MRARIWRNGRFSWLLVVLLAYGTLCVLAFDYAWRLIEAPFEALLIPAVLIWVGGSIIAIVSARRIHLHNSGRRWVR